MSRRDPLSIFLFASILVLGLMSWRDAAREREITQHAAAIEPLLTGPLKACAVTPVGLGGDEAMFQCPGASRAQTLERVRQALSAEAPPARFARFAARDAQGTTRCARDLVTCTDHPLPDRRFYEEARRRRPRIERQSPGS